VTVSETPVLVSIDDVRQAAERVRGVAIKTPLLPFRDLGWVKPENLQPTGSFKIRGAYNTLAQLSMEQRRVGVVAHSSGNHAQAVARAARLLEVRAVVVMPDNAPKVKVDGVRADGAEIVFVGPHNEERVRRAHEIADADGLELVSSANDVRVVAGQGTIGLEVDEQARDAGIDDPLVVLSAGWPRWARRGRWGGHQVAAAALFRRWHRAGDGRGHPRLARRRASCCHGRPRKPAERSPTGCAGEAPAEIPFEHLKRYIDRIVLVDEDEIARAVAIAARELRLVLEPSGAVSLAGLLFHGGELPAGQRIAILTGGNVDTDRYVEFLRHV